jgi:hypothetical protein
MGAGLVGWVDAGALRLPTAGAASPNPKPERAGWRLRHHWRVASCLAGCGAVGPRVSGLRWPRAAAPEPCTLAASSFPVCAHPSTCWGTPEAAARLPGHHPLCCCCTGHSVLHHGPSPTLVCFPPDGASVCMQFQSQRAFLGISPGAAAALVTSYVGGPHRGEAFVVEQPAGAGGALALRSAATGRYLRVTGRDGCGACDATAGAWGAEGPCMGRWEACSQPSTECEPCMHASQPPRAIRGRGARGWAAGMPALLPPRRFAAPPLVPPSSAPPKPAPTAPS